MPKKSLMTYEEVLAKYPDWLVIDTDAYWREETPELTEQSRLRVKRRLGVYLRFMQDHGLVRQVLCSSAPDIPDDFKVYLRDVTPEGYEFHRTGYSKWVGVLHEASIGRTATWRNFSLGEATADQARVLGEAWVGPGYKLASDGRTMVSADGLRQYRPPAPKLSAYATTGVQANFQGRASTETTWTSNGHQNFTK